MTSMAGREGGSDDRIVDLVLATHNQQDYVAQVLDSVVHQDYAHGLHVIVADDGSTDSTVRIIRDYAARHPGIRFIFLDNSLRRGVTGNYRRVFEACTASYVAILEGDDYWCRPRKPSMQVDFLEGHADCAMCGCNYYVLNETGPTLKPRVPEADGFRLFDPRMLIRNNVVSNFFTSMYRRSALPRIPARLYDIKAYDWIVNICVGMHGRVGFLNEPLSVYRIHPQGAWNRMSPLEKLEEQLDLIPHYDRLTELAFHAEFEELNSRLRRMARVHKIMSWLVERCLPSLLRLLRHRLRPVAVRMMRRLAGG